MNDGRDVDPQRLHFGTSFERFQLGEPPRHFGLGVQHPAYNRAQKRPRSANDIGLMLLLNRPIAPGDDPMLVAAGAAPGLNATVTVVGFTDTTSGAFASKKRKGEMKISALFPDEYEDEFRYDINAAGGPYSHTEKGDSGGPHFKDGKIVAITVASETGTSSWGTRVDQHLGFVHGNGADGKRVIDRFIPGADPNWSNHARWRRTSANTPAAPMPNDIAVLDPTSGADNGIHVAMDAPSDDLDGLLTDVTLNIRNSTLRVTGTVGKADGSAIGTGALNGGVINVGGGASGQNGNLEVGWSMDNQGTINILQRGTARIGRALPSTGFLDTVFWNGDHATFAVNGGTATVDLALRNGNSVSVANGALDVGFYLPKYVGVPANLVGPRAVTNGFTSGTSGNTQFAIGANGVLAVTNGDGKRTAVFRNNATGDIRLTGAVAGPARANIDEAQNFGRVILAGQSNANLGHLDVHRSFENRDRGRLEINDFGYARFGSLVSGDAVLAGDNKRNLVLYSDTNSFIGVDGGAADVDLRMVNWGSTFVARGTLHVGKSLPEFIGNPIANPDAIINGRGNAAEASASFSIRGGGTLNVTNLDPKRTAEFDNRRTGEVSIFGNDAGPAVANIDRFISHGEVGVHTRGTLNVYGHLINRRLLTAGGGADGNGNVSGWILNELNAELFVHDGGRVTARIPAGRPDGDSLRNDRNATVYIEGNGLLTIQGRASNQGTIKLTSDAHGAARLRIEPRFGNDVGTFHNLNRLSFDRDGAASRPQFNAVDTNMVFSDGSRVGGPGDFLLQGRTSLVNASSFPGNNWNQVSLTYDGAFGVNNAFVPLEAGNKNIGPALAGLGQPFALLSLCVSNNSRVQLVDDFFNEASPAEAVYTRFLGVDASSTVDLANRKLYYRRIDPHCGLNLTRFVNGQPIRLVPEPATFVFLVIGALMLIVRRGSAEG
jgi:hypothetical protein